MHIATVDVLALVILAGALPGVQLEVAAQSGTTSESSSIDSSALSSTSETSQTSPSTLSSIPLADTATSFTSTEPAQESTSLYTSKITFNNPDLSIQTITSTDLPNPQTPTVTSALQNEPDTSGTINTTLQTNGNPPVQPFPTSHPTETTNLQPIATTFSNTTDAASEPTNTQTITIPLTTSEMVVPISTVATVAQQTVITVTDVSVIFSTLTSDSTTITVSSVGTVVTDTTATALVQTTLSGSSVSTATIATVVTTAGALTDLPTASPSCGISLSCSGQDVFQPVALGQPPSNIERRGGHPERRVGIIVDDTPIETNKFYTNFLIGLQSFPIFTTPYSLAWSKGSGNAQSWGMAVSHVDSGQKVFGPANTAIPGSPNSYFINPLGIQSIILSASELGSNTVMTSDNLLAFSANIHLLPFPGAGSLITFPVVQGMGFVTAKYSNLQPAIQSSVFFRRVAMEGSPRPGVYKYRVILEDGKTWLIYATSSNGISPNFQLVSSTLLQGVPGWFGDIQIAKAPTPEAEIVYDAASGVYPTTASLSGFAKDSHAQYSFSWTKGGTFASNTTLLMFALPHHIQSFDNTTTANVTNLKLDTLTKGVATAVHADCWVLEENNLPTTMGFAPWRVDNGTVKSLSQATILRIQPISADEANQNMSVQTNLNSMYYSGKGLSKFATLVYVMSEFLDQKDLANAALLELEDVFSVFSENRQEFPLLYDMDWKGLVSSASYVTGDSGVDFGNSYYNDHHFHYGYFIHAAAIVGHLDPSWLARNKDYINTLVRDVSNPSSLDQYFPLFRSFDWYSGHSWAKGLYESGDGKDQESTSEDAMFAYGLKMWGKTIGDASMEARGNLMLSVLTRSLQNYFLMESSNVNQPAQFIGNKVTGIMFENKIDHVTYFGANIEYIQGIHMIPIMPFSTMTRTQNFVTEEWNTYFGDGSVRPASEVLGGWKGILYSNLALINPTAAFNFFSQPNFEWWWIDGGATRTWYLVYSAMLGGA